MWEWIPTAASFISSLWGSSQSRAGQSEANQANVMLGREQMDWSAGQAAENRQFQERMSDTSHQRAVKDLSAAGLNPMLSVMHGGASQPQGSVGSSPGFHEMKSARGAGVAAASSAALASASVQKLLSESRLAAKQTEKVDTEEKLLRVNLPDAPELRHLEVVRGRVENHIRTMEENLKERRYQWEYFGRDEGGGQVARLRAELEQIREETRHAKTGGDLQAVEARLKNLDLPRGMSYAEFYKGAAGKVAPYIHSASEGLRSLGSSAIGYRLLRSPGKAFNINSKK